jgi:hypothetical protein
LEWHTAPHISNWPVTTTHLHGPLQGGHPPRQLRDLGDGDEGLEVPRQLLHGFYQVRRLAVLVALYRPLQLVCGAACVMQDLGVVRLTFEIGQLIKVC